MLIECIYYANYNHYYGYYPIIEQQPKQEIIKRQKKNVSYVKQRSYSFNTEPLNTPIVFKDVKKCCTGSAYDTDTGKLTKSKPKPRKCNCDNINEWIVPDKYIKLNIASQLDKPVELSNAYEILSDNKDNIDVETVISSDDEVDMNDHEVQNMKSVSSITSKENVNNKVEIVSMYDLFKNGKVSLVNATVVLVDSKASVDDVTTTSNQNKPEYNVIKIALAKTNEDHKLQNANIEKLVQR